MHVPVDPLFFFNDTATTEIYTLSLHDALPISFSAGEPPERRLRARLPAPQLYFRRVGLFVCPLEVDRKSTRLNSSHQIISYAVFCLEKKRDDLGLASELAAEHSADVKGVLIVD